jgi:hypothetical protein
MDITTLDASGLMSLQARLLKVAAIYGEGWTPALTTVGDLAIKTTECRTLHDGSQVWLTKRANWYLTGAIGGQLLVQVEVKPRSGHPATAAIGAGQLLVALDADVVALHEAFGACLMEAEVSLRHVCDLQRMVDTPVRHGIALNDARVGEVVRFTFGPFGGDALNRTTAEVTDGN